MTIEIHPMLKSFIRPSAHSKFSPSSAERWWHDACSASLRLSQGVETAESKYAVEGTLAHNLCEAMFNKEVFFEEIPPKVFFDIAKFEKEQDREVLQEMIGHAEQYVHVLLEYLRAVDLVGKPLWFGVERGVPIFPEESCFGTGDFVLVGSKAAVVIDFKYGVGKVVPASSLQLRLYLAGVFRHLKNLPKDYKFISVVHQPRVDHNPSVAEFTPSEINQDLNDCWKSIQKTKDKNEQPCIGDYCFFCPANRPLDPAKRCPAKQKVALEVAAIPFKDYLQDLTAPVSNAIAANPKRDAAIIKLLSYETLLTGTIAELKEEVRVRLLNGEHLEGLELADKLGNRSFSYKDEQIATAIRKSYPTVDPYKTETKLRSLGDLEKEIGIKDVLTPLTQRKITKEIRVVPEKERELVHKLLNLK